MIRPDEGHDEAMMAPDEAMRALIRRKQCFPFDLLPDSQNENFHFHCRRPIDAMHSLRNSSKRETFSDISENHIRRQ